MNKIQATILATGLALSATAAAAYQTITVESNGNFYGICSDGRSSFSGGWDGGAYVVSVNGSNQARHADRNTAIYQACGG